MGLQVWVVPPCPLRPPRAPTPPFNPPLTLPAPHQSLFRPPIPPVPKRQCLHLVAPKQRPLPPCHFPKCKLRPPTLSLISIGNLWSMLNTVQAQITQLLYLCHQCMVVWKEILISWKTLNAVILILVGGTFQYQQKHPKHDYLLWDLRMVAQSREFLRPCWVCHLVHASMF